MEALYMGKLGKDQRWKQIVSPAQVFQGEAIPADFRAQWQSFAQACGVETEVSFGKRQMLVARSVKEIISLLPIALLLQVRECTCPHHGEADHPECLILDALDFKSNGIKGLSAEVEALSEVEAEVYCVEGHWTSVVYIPENIPQVDSSYLGDSAYGWEGPNSAD